MTEFSGRVWRGGEPVDVELDMAAISDYLAQDDTPVWADVYDPDHDTLTALLEELGLNGWAVRTPSALPSAPRPRSTKPTPSSPSTPWR